MSQQVRHIFEQQDLRAVGAEFANEPDDFEESLAPVVFEAHLRSRHGKRLARKTGRQDIDRYQVVGNHREFLNRFVVQRGRREVGGIGLGGEVTRLPVTAAFENLEAGATVDQITEWFDIEGSGDRSA
jgi:hypothetical protein